MKNILAIFSIVVSASANAGEGSRCWFGSEGKGEPNCKVRLVEEDMTASREKTKLSVECNCDFELYDEYTKRFEKSGDLYNLGTQRSKLALLVIKDDALVNGGREGREATLLISKGQNGTGEVMRLEGRCKQED